jgi:hypothetical protein
MSIKKFKYWCLTIIFIGLSMSSCSYLLKVSTKNWKKDLITKETDDYKLSVKQNLSQGCPQSMHCLSLDSICFNNSFLPTVIKLLIDKTSSRTVFENMGNNKYTKLDIYYGAKRSQLLIISKDTLIHLLGNRIKFAITFDSISSKVYAISIVDKTKLERHIDNGKLFRTSLPENRIEIYGGTLSSISKDLENNLKILIDADLDEKAHYKMVIPSDNINNLMAYFKEECGIEFIEKQMKVEIAKVTFKD